MFYKIISNYLKEFFLWLLEARLAFLCCSVILIASAAGFYFWPSIQSIRISGFVLQVLGMLLAFRSLLKIREYFGQPPLKHMCSLWIKNAPKWRKNGTLNAPSTTIGVEVNAGLLEVWAGDDPSKSIEKRIENIIENMEFLKKEQRYNKKRIENIDKKNRKLEKLLDEKIYNVKEELYLKIESSLTNDIIVSFVGLVWLTLGIILATIPTELYTLIFL